MMRLDESEIISATLPLAALQRYLFDIRHKKMRSQGSELLEKVADLWREERRHVDLRNCPPFRAREARKNCVRFGECANNSIRLSLSSQSQRLVSTGTEADGRMAD